jgi:type II secretory pathway predicted ATPase ExeA
MYQSFYGLSGKPFSLLPDGDFLFLSKRHRQVVNLLEYGLVTESGFVVITGDVGAGKTTVVRRFLKKTGDQMVVGLINNPTATLGRLLNWIALAFDFKDRNADDATLYNHFIEFLLDHYAQGRRVLLIIDEAQNLTVEKLEELRMLSNVNNEKDMLLQIMLVGQPELLETLNRPDLRQFVQRISVHCHLSPLEPVETAAYIRHRLAHVGGNAALFDDIACAAVHHFTGGVPRLINLLCDQALVYGYSEEEPTITFDLVTDVVMDRAKFGLSAFQNVPEMFMPSDVMGKIKPYLDAIKDDQSKRGELK